MSRILKVAFAAALAAAALTTSARADVQVNTAPVNSPAATVNADTAPLSRFGWAGIGLYGARYSVSDGIYSASATDTAFGINIGAALAVASLSPGLNLDVWGNVAAVLGTGDYFPITAGAGVSYDKLPVEFFGGLGFSVVPNSGNLAVGLDVMLMALYPLPQVSRHFAVQGQLNFDILNESLMVWSLSVGGALSF